MAVAQQIAWGPWASTTGIGLNRTGLRKPAMRLPRRQPLCKCTCALTGVHPFCGCHMSGTDTNAGGPDYLMFCMQG